MELSACYNLLQLETICCFNLWPFAFHYYPTFDKLHLMRHYNAARIMIILTRLISAIVVCIIVALNAPSIQRVISQLVSGAQQLHHYTLFAVVYLYWRAYMASSIDRPKCFISFKITISRAVRTVASNWLRSTVVFAPHENYNTIILFK